jgi:uncharacterized protein (DUF433 family)
MPIIVDPSIVCGKPVVQGTRVPVVTILEQLAAGLSVAHLLLDFDLRVEDIRDALTFTGAVVDCAPTGAPNADTDKSE